MRPLAASPPNLKLCIPVHRNLYPPPENQDVEGPCPVLLKTVVARVRDAMIAHASHILNHNLVLARLPCIYIFPYPTSDCPISNHVAHALQNHRLEDDEMLRVPPTCPNYPELVAQSPHKSSPHLPSWCVVPPLWHHV